MNDFEYTAQREMDFENYQETKADEKKALADLKLKRAEEIREGKYAR